MFDPLSVIIFSLKNFVQRIKGIFSFVFDNYFPDDNEAESEDVVFTFL
ncbi:MAG: hypothetical protein IJW86_09750 [Clostridia bacterium]|nr:hypothetical protein [Clostridia bacterium]